LLDLALDLSKAMLKTVLEVKPELVLPVAREAIRYLPALQQPALLYLHPADSALVREEMQAELEKAGWRVVDDATLTRGGCRVETGSNQIDAGVETRWERLAAALGRENAWLA
jgi:flagellar assembly protein FliH